MSRADNDNPVPHSVQITVKASVALATGQASTGKMAKTNRADPTSKVFAKFLEALLLTAAKCGPGATGTFNFKRIKQRQQKWDEFVSVNFRLAFGEKVFCGRILKSKLAAPGATIKKDFTISMNEVVNVVPAVRTHSSLRRSSISLSDYCRFQRQEGCIGSRQGMYLSCLPWWYEF